MSNYSDLDPLKSPSHQPGSLDSVLSGLGAGKDWVDKNVVHPAADTLKENYNTLANIAGGVLPRVTIEEKTNQDQPAFMSAEYLAQHLSSGLATAACYALAGKVMGSVLKGGGRFLCLEGATARLAASEHAAQILGATVLDGYRDLHAGETHLGNAAGGFMSFLIYEGGNSLTAKCLPLKGLAKLPANASLLQRTLSYTLPRATRLPLQALTGGLGGLAQIGTARGLFGTGQPVTSDELLQAIRDGAVMNIFLPATQHVLGKEMNRVSQWAGWGIPVRDYMQEHNLQGRSATLDAQVNQKPLARIQPSEISLAEPQQQLVRMAKPDAAILAHEMAHLGDEERRLQQSDLSFTRKLWEQANSSPSWVWRSESGVRESYIWDRARAESRARKVEQAVRTETNDTTTSVETSPSKILDEHTPDGLTYRKRFEKEFEDFKKDPKNYRPPHDYAEDKAGTTPPRKATAAETPQSTLPVMDPADASSCVFRRTWPFLPVKVAPMSRGA